MTIPLRNITEDNISESNASEKKSTDNNPNEPEVTCANCQASCCRMEVMLISDSGVPEKHIAVDEWGGETMLRLDDGWCSAVDRETYFCTIYENRPWICREFEMGSYECRDEFKKV